MFAKALIVVALAAYANAGAVTYLANPSVGAQSEQTVRGLGGLSSASHYSKAVDSAFSSVRKFDSRVTNDAYAVRAAPVAYAAPAYAAPAYAAQAYAAPLSYAAPVARVAAPVAYAAPVARVAAAPVAYATPALAPRAIAAPHGLLGVAYSPVSPAVATLTFDGFGIHYGY